MSAPNILPSQNGDITPSQSRENLMIERRVSNRENLGSNLDATGSHCEYELLTLILGLS